MKLFLQKLPIVFLFVLLFGAGITFFFRSSKQALAPTVSTSTTSPAIQTDTTSSAAFVTSTPPSRVQETVPVKPMPSPVKVETTTLSFPLSNALGRITKKPFGISITKQNSPVQPERFSGYHTGVDFETTPDEQKTDVIIHAICDGKLLMKKWATGYGGVAVQSCVLNGEAVTIIYGHLRLSSIKEKVGDTLKAGQTFALLGNGYSTETDGERKHLHLGIHLGSSVNILGYVQSKSALSQWLDAKAYLR